MTPCEARENIGYQESKVCLNCDRSYYGKDDYLRCSLIERDFDHNDSIVKECFTCKKHKLAKD